MFSDFIVFDFFRRILILDINTFFFGASDCDVNGRRMSTGTPSKSDLPALSAGRAILIVIDRATASL